MLVIRYDYVLFLICIYISMNIAYLKERPKIGTVDSFDADRRII
jgi:hypothetical protein